MLNYIQLILEKNVIKITSKGTDFLLSEKFLELMKKW